MSDDLIQKKCIPCEVGGQPISLEEANKYLKQTPSWQMKDNLEINREFAFKDFKSTINFVNQVAELAEEEGHHPDIYVHNWNKLKISLSTHAVGGLTENDFIMAAKIENIKNGINN